jgi:hypothetical protein
MTRSELIEMMAAQIVSNARFWIGVGYDAEAAFTEAMKSSCAGPLPQKIARERLGI